jgi:hypothetical protein
VGGVAPAAPTADATAPRLAPTATEPSAIVGKVAMVAIMLMAIEEGLGLLQFAGLSALAHQLLIFLGRVALGLVIIGVGAWLSNLAAGLIHSSGIRGAEVLGTVARIAILVLVVAMGIEQMGLGNEIVKWTLMIVAGGAGLAIGLAFGLGGQRVAGAWLQRWTGQTVADSRELVR